MQSHLGRVAAAIGVVSGVLLGLPQVAEPLIIVSWWFSVIWVIWVPSLLILLAVRRPWRPNIVMAALVAVTLFLGTFGLTGGAAYLDRDPTTMLVMGSWLAFWLTIPPVAVILRLLGGPVARRPENAPPG